MLGRGILIRSTGKLIFHNKIQQSGINITRLHTSGGRINQSANKIIIVGIWEITQHGGDEILWSGGEENERQMANNVNCEEMRFVIRNLVDVDDVSLATAPEIPFDVC